MMTCFFSVAPAFSDDALNEIENRIVNRICERQLAAGGGRVDKQQREQAVKTRADAIEFIKSLKSNAGEDNALRRNYVTSLCKLAMQCRGVLSQLEFKVQYVYVKKLENGGRGNFHPSLPTKDPKSVINDNKPTISMSASGLRGSFQFQLYVAIHEVIHAEHFDAFSRQDRFKGAPHEKIAAAWSAEAESMSPGDRHAYELHVDRLAYETALDIFGEMPQDAENGAAIYWFSHSASKFFCSMIPSAMTAKYSKMIAGVRSAFGRGDDGGGDKDPGSFDRTIRGFPFFGGIILGNRQTADSDRCVAARIQSQSGRAVLQIDVRTHRGIETVVVDEFSSTDLWAAYHIVHPTDWMQVLAGVEASECNLVSGQQANDGSSEFYMHPALSMTPVGEQMVELELISGSMFLGRDISVPKSGRTMALQWYDATSRIRVEGNKLTVRPADGRGPNLLRLRLVEASDAKLKEIFSAELARKASSLVINESLGEDPHWYTIANLARSLLSVPELRDASYQERTVDQEKAMSAISKVTAATQSLESTDKFARILAIMNWIKGSVTVEEFPKWPADQPLDFVSFPLKRSDDNIHVVPTVPLPPSMQELSPSEIQWYLVRKGNQSTGRVAIAKNSKQADPNHTRVQYQTVDYKSTLGELNADIVECDVLFNSDGSIVKFGWIHRIDTEEQLSVCGVRKSNQLIVESKIKDKIETRKYSARFGIMDQSCISLAHLHKGMARGESRLVNVLYLPDNEPSVLTLEKLDLESNTVSYDHAMEVKWSTSNIPQSIALNAQEYVTFNECTAQEANSPENIKPSAFQNTFELNETLLTSETLDRVSLKVELEDSLDGVDFPDSQWSIVNREGEHSIIVESDQTRLGTTFGPTRLNDRVDRRPDDLRWVASTDLIQHSHAEIQKHARAIADSVNGLSYGGKRSPEFVLVSQTVGYVASKMNCTYQFRDEWLKAEVIGENLQGDCTENSTFLTALLRSKGIPARIVVGYVTSARVWVGHAWVEAYFDGSWYRLDPSLLGVETTTIYLKTGNVDDSFAPPQIERPFKPKRIEVLSQSAKSAKSKVKVEASLGAFPRIPKQAAKWNSYVLAVEILEKECPYNTQVVATGTPKGKYSFNELLGQSVRLEDVVMEIPLQFDQNLDVLNYFTVLRKRQDYDTTTTLDIRYGSEVGDAFRLPFAIEYTRLLCKCISPDLSSASIGNIVREKQRMLDRLGPMFHSYGIPPDVYGPLIQTLRDYDGHDDPGLDQHFIDMISALERQSFILAQQH